MAMQAPGLLPFVVWIRSSVHMGVQLVELDIRPPATVHLFAHPLETRLWYTTRPGECNRNWDTVKYTLFLSQSVLVPEMRVSCDADIFE